MNTEATLPPVDNTVPASSALDMITTLDEFASRVTEWHTQQVHTLLHVLEMPEGSEIALDEEAPIMLTGDAHKAFLIGVNLSLHYLGTLPFVEVPEEAADAQAA